MKYFSAQKLLVFVVIFIGFLVTLSSTVFAAPPEGFSTSSVVPNLSSPTGFSFLPDGRIFIIEKNGTVKVYKDGEVLSDPFVTLTVNQDGERGLLGIAVDPDYSTNHFIYFNYTGTDLKNKIIRFNASSDKATDTGTIIKEIQMSTSFIHVGGTIQFGPDEKLYVSIGDSGTRENAQKLDNLHGKVLRLNKDGSTPSDNPFVGQEGALGEIWAYGLRNPFRFQFDEVSGKLYLGDVGENTWEEINIITKGGNFGWPEAEGSCTSCSYSNPFYVYQRLPGGGSSITGGPVYRGSMFPSEFLGDLFFADYVSQDIKRLNLDSTGGILGNSDFDPEAGAVVDLKTSSDGSLYYLTIFPGKLNKITYTSANRPPVVKAKSDKTSGLSPLAIVFSSEGSNDPEGETLTYFWNFGDGTSSTQTNPTKVYSEVGTYSARLTISDGNQNTVSEPIVISVGEESEITINQPINNSRYNAGDIIQYSANASENGTPLSEEKIKTEVIFHHNEHIHPFLIREHNSSGEFTIPTEGHTAVDTWYEIKFTAVSSGGISSTKSVYIYPNTTKFTVNTEPSGLKVYVDELPVTTPAEFEGVVGFQHSISATATQEFEGSTYYFEKWGNTPTAKQEFVATDDEKAFTAYFSKSQQYYAQYYNNKNLSGNPTVTRWEKAINFDWGDQGSPANEIPKDNFSARFVGKQDFPAGNYTFTLGGDDGVRLYIDGVLVIDAWKDQGRTMYTENVQLSAGVHEVKVEYYENGGGANLSLFWEYQDTNDESMTYKASYYDNKAMTSTPVLERNEFEINNNWGHNSPSALVPTDNFSAVWEGKKTFTEGFYKFNFITDDGFRLYIDGEKVLDRWFAQSSGNHSVEQFIGAGEHTIRLEFFEGTGSAIIKMSYMKIPTMSQAFTVSYYANKTLSGSPAVTTETTNSNYNWWLFSPAEGVGADNFSVRMTKQQAFQAGEYTFKLSADDGVRFWVDNTLVIDDWNDHARRDYTQTVQMTEGLHTLKIEYYENTGLAELSFEQL